MRAVFLLLVILAVAFVHLLEKSNMPQLGKIVIELNLDERIGCPWMIMDHRLRYCLGKKYVKKVIWAWPHIVIGSLPD